MLKREQKYARNWQFLARHPQITAEMRSILLDWMMQGKAHKKRLRPFLIALYLINCYQPVCALTLKSVRNLVSYD